MEPSYLTGGDMAGNDSAGTKMILPHLAGTERPREQPARGYMKRENLAGTDAAALDRGIGKVTEPNLPGGDPPGLDGPGSNVESADGAGSDVEGTATGLPHGRPAGELAGLYLTGGYVCRDNGAVGYVERTYLAGADIARKDGSVAYLPGGYRPGQYGGVRLKIAPHPHYCGSQNSTPPDATAGTAKRMVSIPLVSLVLGMK